jgi:hypothetical protein
MSIELTEDFNPIMWWQTAPYPSLRQWIFVLSPRAKPIAEFRSRRSLLIIFATTATGDSDGDGNLNALRGSY